MFRFQIKDGFWKRYQELVSSIVIPFQYKILNDEVEGVEKSHAIENFKIAAGKSQGEFYGMVFQDSDVAKWLEAASYSLQLNYDKQLDSTMDEVIALIGETQLKDGYLDTYFIVKDLSHRMLDLQEAHELYCAGHMIEAAVAHYQSTKKTTLLHIMEKNADYLCNYFGKGRHRGFPGHPEIELALCRLYQVTQKKQYLDLAVYFINERGTQPNFYAEQAKARDFSIWNSDPESTMYTQAHAPVREQKEATGHAVRAVYLYTGMALAAYETKDATLLAACKRLWDSITKKQMYLTGGIGSTGNGEAFTKPYDLPNDTAYCETCAAVGLVFFANAMLKNTQDAKYADVMERALYNGVLAGMSQDGKRFFYVNPLEVNPDYDGQMPGYEYIKAERPGWYACACCPPNVARLITSLSEYTYLETEDTLYSNLFISGTYTAKDGSYELLTKTAYPYDGKVIYQFVPKNESVTTTLAIRIPSWCNHYKISVKKQDLDGSYDSQQVKTSGDSSCRTASYEVVNGYARLTQTFTKEDIITVDFTMEPRKVYANLKVSEDCGCAAVTCGPLVYCFEEVDNPDLHELRLKADGQLTMAACHNELFHDYSVVQADGYRLAQSDQLYSYERPKKEEAILTAIPYYLWANRGLNCMRVWLGEEV